MYLCTYYGAKDFQHFAEVPAENREEAFNKAKALYGNELELMCEAPDSDMNHLKLSELSIFWSYESGFNKVDGKFDIEKMQKFVEDDQKHVREYLSSNKQDTEVLQILKMIARDSDFSKDLSLLINEPGYSKILVDVFKTGEYYNSLAPQNKDQLARIVHDSPITLQNDFKVAVKQDYFGDKKKLIRLYKKTKRPILVCFGLGMMSAFYREYPNYKSIRDRHV